MCTTTTTNYPGCSPPVLPFTPIIQLTTQYPNQKLKNNG